MRAVRVGNALDAHTVSADPDRPLVLCGVTIPGAPGLEGHSDADAGAHAVADALLGAAALGDLGSRFGVDRPALRGADSMGLLEQVVGEVHAAGWSVGNLDVTLVARAPRLARFRRPMRERLAAACRVPLEAVSVKFTTTDGLGSIGRGEGVVAWASCLLLTAHG